MGAQRAAWIAASKAEEAALFGKAHGIALLDLVKAFELIQHHLLVEAASALGYSMSLLRMALAA